MHDDNIADTYNPVITPPMLLSINMYFKQICSYNYQY